MFRRNKDTLFYLLFGFILKTQLVVSQDFGRFGAPFAGTPFAGAPFSRGPQFGPQFGTQFRGFDGPPQFGGGAQFGGQGIGGGPGGFNGGPGIGGGPGGFNGGPGIARRMTSALAARRRAMAASRARAVPGAIPQTFEQAVASFNNVFNPVRIPPTTTTTTTPRPPESVNWLGLNNPMQRGAAPRNLNQGRSFQNNQMFQQQRASTNRNVAFDRQRTPTINSDPNRQFQSQSEFRGGNIRQAVPTFQSFSNRGTQSTGNRNTQGRQFQEFNSNDRQSIPNTFSRNARPVDRRTQGFQEITVEQQTLPPVTIFSRTSQQLGREIRPVQRFRDINTVDQEIPRMRAIPTAESNAQIMEFRRQIDRRNRERLRNAEMFRNDLSSQSFTDGNSNRFHSRPEQTMDAGRSDRPRSNMLRDFEPQTRSRTFETDNRLQFNDRQIHQFQTSNTGTQGTAPLDLSTMPRDLSQRSRSVMHTRTGADGTREIVIDIAPDTSTTTDWSLVNEFLSNNREFRPATSFQNFDLSQSVPQSDNVRFRQNEFASSSTREPSIPTDRFNVGSSVPDTGQRRAAPIELNQLSRGLDWGVVDDFMQQRQSRQSRGRGRQAATAAAAAGASSATNNRLQSTGGSLPGEALTFNSVNPSQFTFASDRNVLNTVDSDPNNFGSMGFSSTG